MRALPCVKSKARGKPLHSMESSAQCSGMIWRAGMAGWEEDARGRGYRYTYSGFTSLCIRNQHNIVK